MTREEAIRKHRELWNVVVQLLKKGKTYQYAYEFKTQAFRLGETDIPSNSCYLCGFRKCHVFECILKWPGKFGDCVDDLENDGKGLYSRFTKAIIEREFEIAIKLAEEIRDLPEREMETIPFNIEWAERTMIISVNVHDVERAEKVIEEAYSRWLDLDENPELQYECCEEYIHSQLTKAGIEFVDEGSVNWEEED